MEIDKLSPPDDSPSTDEVADTQCSEKYAQPEGDFEPPPPWNRLPGTDCVRRWALSLSEAVASKSGGGPDLWRLLGRGIVIQCHDPERGRQILARVAADSGLRFLSVSAAEVPELPIAADTLAGQIAPALVHLEAGPWLKSKEGDQGPGNESRAAYADFRAKLAARLRSFDPEHPVLLFALVLGALEEADEALRAMGLFDLKFSVPQPTPDYLGNEFIEDVGRDLCSATMQADARKVGRLIADHDSRRTRDLALIAMQRLAWREQRKLEFVDLVRFKVCGTAESDPLPLLTTHVRQQMAWHEAGHAVTAILDSNGRSIPDYATIVSGGESRGFVVKSYMRKCELDECWIWRDIVFDVRVSLAGRAAEELLVGRERLGIGSQTDLKSATHDAVWMFGRYGFSGHECSSGGGGNLAVFDWDAPSPSEKARLEDMVRGFLDQQYEHVLTLLAAHRQLLEAVAARLLEKPVLDQAELAAIWRANTTVV